MKKYDRIKAFTMAEVLITVGVLGVVIAMTLPSLVAKHRHKVLETEFKKYYSILSQTASAAGYEYNNCNGVYQEDIKKYIFEKLNKNSEKILNASDKTPMFPSDYKQYTLTGREANERLHMNCLIGNNNWVNDWGTGYQAILNDGSFVGICSHVAASDFELGEAFSNGMYITIDVNGQKNPNRFGQDIWNFHIATKNCAIEAAATFRNFDEGESSPTGAPHEYSKLCSLTDYTSDSNGFYCAYYAIQDKCPDGSGKFQRNSSLTYKNENKFVILSL